MSPIGRSGKFHMNPHHMRAVNDAPEEGSENSGDKGNAKEHASGAAKGDGKHHHEMTKHEDGSYSSKHTHPDGREDHADHPDFHDAQKHEAGMMEEEPMEQDEPDGDEGGGGKMGAGASGSSSSGALASMYE